MKYSPSVLSPVSVCSTSQTGAPSPRPALLSGSVAMSPLEVGEAMLDGLGPEVAGDVLWAVPALLDKMPPEFFHLMADLETLNSSQQEVEEEMLGRATQAAWAALSGPDHSCGTVGMGNTGDQAGDNRSPLGPRLGWLASEELARFYHGAQGGNVGRAGRGAGVSGIAKVRSDGEESEGNLGGREMGWGSFSSMLALPVGESTGESSAARLDSVVEVTASRLGLNFLIPGRSHRGMVILPDTPCCFCSLPLAELPGALPLPSSVGSRVEPRGEVAVPPCGHSYHVRCGLESFGSTIPPLSTVQHKQWEGRGSGGGGVGGLREDELVANFPGRPLPCPTCCALFGEVHCWAEE
ncbi:unnamed protein product [Choristocarpus tenellus]